MTATLDNAHRARKCVELPTYVLPYDLISSVFPDETNVCLLENPGEPTALGRYSFLGVDPFCVFHSKRAACFAGPPGAVVPLAGRPLDELGVLLRAYAHPLPMPEGLPPFTGGAVGYLSYEMLYEIEDIPDRGRDDVAVPDSYFMFCDVVVAADHLDRRTWIIANGFGPTQAIAEARAAERLATTQAAVGRFEERRNYTDHRDAIMEKRRATLAARPRLLEEHFPGVGVRPVMDRAAYVALVERAKEHIMAGDIFEICTSQRFDTRLVGVSGLELYGLLRVVNPAPFAGYLRLPGVEIASTSPERFLRLDRDRWAESRPIKGTRPRSSDPVEDQRLRDDLAACEKDRAENVMIVDLARNDLGRVCEFNSVTVPEFQIIESYQYTHQMVSTIRGRLAPECDAMDLIRAAFPGGSMTGAPKVEAMKIIDRLEPTKRGVFAGSIGYFDFDGAFDLGIVIRTFVKVGDALTFHVGGAIVADSDAQEEYQETLDKAHGLVTALEFVRERAARK